MARWPRKKKRILWLHTQPEFYHNCMLDDLARGTGYRLPGMPDAHSDEFEWIAGFAYEGTGVYTQNALPAVARTIFLRTPSGRESRPPTLTRSYHLDWRADLRTLGDGPLGPDAIILSGYGQPTFRQIIAQCARQHAPLCMWSDSNLRADRGTDARIRFRRWSSAACCTSMAKPLTFISPPIRAGWPTGADSWRPQAAGPNLYQCVLFRLSADR